MLNIHFFLLMVTFCNTLLCNTFVVGGDSGWDLASESGEFSHYGCDGFFLRPILSWVGSTRPGANRIRQRAVDLPRPGPGVRWGTGAQLRRYSHPAGPLIFPAASLGSPHSA